MRVGLTRVLYTLAEDDTFLHEEMFGSTSINLPTYSCIYQNRKTIITILCILMYCKIDCSHLTKDIRKDVLCRLKSLIITRRALSTGKSGISPVQDAKTMMPAHNIA